MFKRKPKKTIEKTSPSEINPNDTLAAIKKLKTTQSTLEKRVEFLRKKAAKQNVLAKDALHEKDKPKALLILKRKKVLEKECLTLEASILTMEEQILRIEGGAATSDVFDALKLATDVLKRVNARVDPEKLAEMMGDIEDLNADQDEVQNILRSPMTDALDDADLLAEFERLEGDELEAQAFKELNRGAGFTADSSEEDEQLLQQLQDDEKELLDLENLVTPTTVPKQKPKITAVVKKPVARNAEDDELAMLEAEMMA